MRYFKANADFIGIFKIVISLSYYYKAGCIQCVVRNIFSKNLKPVKLCICPACYGSLFRFTVIFNFKRAFGCAPIGKSIPIRIFI